MTYLPDCSYCGNKLKARIPKGITGIFFLSEDELESGDLGLLD